eukprot:SAG11_NODE_9945_length_867_cov_1.204427_2_plen_123_part_01
MAIASDPIQLTDKVAIMDKDGYGFTVFVELQAKPVQLTVGMALGITVCVEDCDGSEEYMRHLTFQGEISATLSLTSAPELNGEFRPTPDTVTLVSPTQPPRRSPIGATEVGTQISPMRRRAGN